MDLTPVDLALRYLSILLTGMALLRLLNQRLASKPPFRAFAFMLAFGLARDFALLLIPYNSHTYAIAWEISLPPLLFVHGWAAFATYRSLVALYPRGAQVVNGLLGTCVAIMVILCCIATPFETMRIVPSEALLRTVFLLHRWVDTLSGGALLLAAVFLSQNSKPLKPLPVSLLRHTFLLAVYFTVSGVTWMVENLVPLGAAAWIERADLALVSCLYMGWICSLSATGEKTRVWRPAEQSVKSGIDRINQAALSLLALRGALNRGR